MENTKETIKKILQENFTPNFLEVHDDSGRHAGHVGARGGGGHYQVTIVSRQFKDKTLIEQHRLVNESLKSLFEEKVHALALKTYSPEQWDFYKKS